MNVSQFTHYAVAIRAAVLLFLSSLTYAQTQHGAHHEEPSRTLPAGYTLETVSIPQAIELEVGGLAVREDGTVVITTRGGEVWEYTAEDDNWRRLAYGLYYPLGVEVDRETGDLIITQMTELTRLVDEDEDGDANLSLTITDQWGLSGNYHEYAFGPVRDREGNFYVTLNLAHSNQGAVKNSTMGRPAPYRGWALKIAPDGQVTPFASGFRSPAGIGINSEDEIFVTDNEGDWVATSFLAHIREGRFYGHPSSLADDPRFREQDLDAIPSEEYDRWRSPAAVYFPHLAMAQSPGEPIFDETAGAFGPFHGQVFVGDQTKSKVMRISLEKVGGEYQGAVFNFAQNLDSGVLRHAFSPDGGTLWAGQTDRGWSSVGGKPFSLQKIVYDGHTIPFEMHSVHVKNDGFEIVFTKPVDRQQAGDPGNYAVKHWTYHYHPDYGSPYVDETPLEIAYASVSSDGLRVRLTSEESLPVKRVYEIALSNISGEAGEHLLNHTGYYTLNNLPEE